MTRTTRFVEIGDHDTPLRRHFLVIADDPSGPAVADIQARLVTFLQGLLAMPSLLSVGPVATPNYTVSHDGERWFVRGEGESGY